MTLVLIPDRYEKRIAYPVAVPVKQAIVAPGWRRHGDAGAAGQRTDTRRASRMISSQLMPSPATAWTWRLASWGL